MLRAYGPRRCYTWSCKHVGVAEIIAYVLQRFSHTHVLCYKKVWGAEIGPAAAGPAGPAPTALIIQYTSLPKAVVYGFVQMC